MGSLTENVDIIAGLDIASTKVCMVVCSVTDSNQTSHLEILASHSVPNTGLLRGTVVDINSCVNAIKNCIQGIYEKCGVNVTKALVSVSGDYIRSHDSKTSILVHDSEIDNNDIDRLMKEAKVINVPEKHEVIHVIPKNFTVDEEDGIVNPEGMYGNKLEMEAHIITSRSTAIKNIIRCLVRANLKVNELVLTGLASSISVLNEDEKQLGVALVDIGGGTSKILIYIRGMLAYTSVIPIGGINITNDIAVGLRINQKDAGELKCKYGFAMPSAIIDQEEIEISDGKKKFVRK